MPQNHRITSIRPVTDKAVLKAHLSEEPFLNAYSIGDLDPFFWPRTRWLGAYSGETLLGVILIYRDDSLPVVLAVDSRVEELGAGLLDECVPHLPGRFYSHLSPSLFRALERHYAVEPHGTHLKMGLTGKEFRKAEISETGPGIRRLTLEDLERAKALYAVAYPGNWFVPRMLETGKYFGAFSSGDLVGIAGVHVYSREFGIAALGNITVHPDWRGHGLARQVTSALTEDLLPETPVVTLNVKDGNLAAIRCYEALGFRITGSYEEAFVIRN